MKEKIFANYRLFHNDETPHLYSADEYEMHIYSDDYKAVVEVRKWRFSTLDLSTPYFAQYKTMSKNGNRRVVCHGEFKTLEEVAEWMRGLKHRFSEASKEYASEPQVTQ